jgi:phosphoserine phosphatase RsbU/P
MMKDKGLAYKLSVYILAGVGLIFGSTFVYNYATTRSLLLSKVEENTRNLSSSAINKSEGFFRSIEKVALSMRYVIENSEKDEAELHSLIKDLVLHNEEIYGSCVAFEPYEYRANAEYYAPYFYEIEEGEIDYVDLAEDDYRYPEWDWYQIPKILNESVWSEPYYDEGAGNILMTTYSVPFYSYIGGEQKFRGIITVDVSLEWLQSVVNGIQILETGYAFLISSRGTFITHKYNPEWVMNESIFSIAETEKYAYLREIGRSMINGEEGFKALTKGLYHDKSRIYHSHLSNNNWSLGFIFPEEELYSSLNELNNNLIIIGVFGLGLLLAIIIFISNRITKPLYDLAVISKDIGTGNFDQEIPKPKYNDEVGVLYTSFNSMQQELKNYIQNLKTTTAAKEKIESELKVAHDIQMGMIPQEFPAFPDRKEFDIYGFISPAKDVGGDLYDFFFIDENRFCFALGDVSGKGTPAALFMAIATTLLRAKAKSGLLQIDEVVKQMNEHLCNNNERGLFVTFFMSILDVRTGEMQYYNAGHNFPVVIGADGNVKMLEQSHHLPLGVFEIPGDPFDTYQFQRGDKIFLYSDGINEAMDTESEQYTDERMMEFLNLTIKRTPKETTESIIADVKKFTTGAEQSDDMTVLVVQYNGTNNEQSS